MEILFETPRHRIKMERDDYPESPADMRCGDADAFLVGFNQRNFWVTVEGFTDPEHVEDWEDTHDVFSLSAYIHSGVHLYLGSDRVCQWDSGQVGYVLIRKSTTPAVIGSAEWHEIFAAQQEYARGIVEEWNQYLSGDVWAVSVQKKSCEECGTWEYADDFDNYGGIYGEEWARESALTELKPQILEAEKPPTIIQRLQEYISIRGVISWLRKKWASRVSTVRS